MKTDRFPPIPQSHDARETQAHSDAQEFQDIQDTPGGVLRLGADGTLIDAPLFFAEALNLHLREVPSIYHLFDPNNAPYLSLTRIFRHPHGTMEFHLSVRGNFGTPHSFRYWALSPAQAGASDPSEVAFYIVDDSALMQNHEWATRRRRREILNDVQTSLSMHFKNRLAAVQVLSEMLQDTPTLAAEIAPRLVDAVRDLNYAFNRITTNTDHWNTARDNDLPIRLGDLASIMATWSMDRITIVGRTHNVDKATLIATNSVERVILPVTQNALEASAPGSVVYVDITEVREGFAHIVIEDAGHGMTEHVRHRAEDPFFTTRPGHLGLGLSQAREALRTAGGQWKIESAPNVGTRITILLPVTTAAHLFR